MGRVIKRTTVTLLLAASLLLAAGCATVPRGPLFSPANVPMGKAVIYFYRPSRFSMAARTIFMAFPTSDRSFAMVNGGYYPLIVDPGAIEVAGVGANATPVRFTVDAAADKPEYVRVEFDGGLSLAPPAKFTKVTEDVGQSEIAGCTLISESE